MSKAKKIVFFGTPEFAVPTLAALVESGNPPALVVSRPARAKGRGHKASDPPVAAWAREHGLEVEQPENVKSEEFVTKIEKLGADVGVVVAFGQIFPQALLDAPKKGCINVHASLLPKYRGASPIHSAILEGEKKTGVTTMQMAEELDAGPILLNRELEIPFHETTGELTERLADLSGELLVETLSTLSKIKPRKQREELATYTSLISKRQAKANWALTAVDFYNRMRAFLPWPGIEARVRGRRVKILWGTPVDWEEAPIGVSGTYLGMRQGRLAILCGAGTIFGIEQMQSPGKRPRSAADFANGARISVGERFV